MVDVAHAKARLPALSYRPARIVIRLNEFSWIAWPVVLVSWDSLPSPKRHLSPITRLLRAPLKPLLRRAPSLLMRVSRSYPWLSNPAPFVTRQGACPLIPVGLRMVLSGRDQNEIPRQSPFHHLRIDKYRWSHFSHTPPRGHPSVRHFNSSR